MVIEIDQNHKKNLTDESTIKQIRQLWNDCFHDPDAYTDFYFDYKVKENEIYVIRKSGEVVSMVQWNPYRLWVHGSEVLSYYIVGVATKEIERRRGLMRVLLNESMKQMRTKQIPFAYLMPASETIYTPFDFRFITRQDRYVMSLQDLMDVEQQEERLHIASLARENITIETLSIDQTEGQDQLAMYANDLMSQSMEVYTIRDAYYYKRMIAELDSICGRLIVVKREQQIIGCGAYTLEEGKVFVLELLCDPMDKQLILDCVLQYARNQAIHLTTQQLVSEEEEPEMPMIMARILHVEKFMELLRADEEVELKIAVIDDILVENTGTYVLNITQSHCSVKRCNENEDDIDVQMNIEFFTRWCFGAIRQNELEAVINQEHSQEIMNKIKKIIPFNKIHINEMV